MATSQSLIRVRSRSWCTRAALALAALSLVACGGEGAEPSPGEGEAGAPTAGTSASGGSGGSDAGSGGTGSSNGKGGTGGGTVSAGNAGEAGDAGESGSGGKSGKGGSGGSSAGTGGKASAGSGGSSAGSAGSGGKYTGSCDDADEVCRSLDSLGVDVKSTPRLDDRGEPLPGSYNPLGSRVRPLFPALELFVGGMRTQGATNPASLLELHDDAADAGVDPQLSRDFANSAWTQSAAHAAVAADVDGDGIQEIVGVFSDASSLRLRVLSNPMAGDQQQEVQIAAFAAESLAMAAGDFDGDGKQELAIAAVRASETQILFVDDAATTFSVIAAQTKHIPRPAGAATHYRLAAGNLDYDGGDELAIVKNEAVNWNGGDANAAYFVWDDQSTGFAELASGDVAFRDGSLYRALAAGVDIVDMDWDGIGEVVLGGVTHADAYPILGHVVATLDDAVHGLTPIAVKYFLDNEASYERDDVSTRYKTVIVKGLDVDGDLRPEVLVNRHVLSNLSQKTSTEAWPLRLALPLDKIQTEKNQFEFASDNAAIAVGDMNADKRDDIVFLGGFKDEVYVYGLTGPNKVFSEIKKLPVTGLARDSHTTPLLVSVNVDRDTALVEYSEPESKLVFTEPVVIAAIAAPPCQDGVGQDTDACTTSYGNTESTSTGSEKSVTLSASLTIGTSFEERVFTQSAIEIEATATLATTSTKGSTYTLEKSVTYTTGAMEDAVVFTTVPYDSYVYRIISHSEPALVGETITINAPREPLTLMVERSFYNQNIATGSLKIDDSVFRHAIGDIASYPTRADVVARGTSIQSAERSVTQTGEVEVGLDVGTERSETQSLALGYEMNVKLTAGGIMGGFSVGTEAESSLSVAHGKSTSYAGRIGAIDAEHFADNQYSFGLFTYKQRAPNGQEFEVLNYWVR